MISDLVSVYQRSNNVAIIIDFSCWWRWAEVEIPWASCHHLVACPDRACCPLCCRSPATLYRIDPALSTKLPRSLTKFAQWLGIYVHTWLCDVSLAFIQNLNQSVLPEGVHVKLRREGGFGEEERGFLASERELRYLLSMWRWSHGVPVVPVEMVT